MAKFADRVVETTQTVGTGTLDLDGAVDGFRAFAERVTTGTEVYYCIEDNPADPAEWEYGKGTLTAGAPNKLSRDTVEDSSNGGNKISLTDGTTYTVTGVVITAKINGGDEVPVLGTAATKNVGTAVGNVVALEDVEGVAKLPQVDGSQLTNIIGIGAAVDVTNGGANDLTQIDFTGIPAGAKRITVNLASLSSNGTSDIVLLIGDADGFEATGYLGSVSTGSTGPELFTANFQLTFNTAAAYSLHGSVILNLLDPLTNTWVIAGDIGKSDGANVFNIGGSKALSGALTQVRLTTAGGADTFDAGIVNILFE